MGNNRVDLYTEVHKGIRRELCDWVGRIGRLDAENAAEVAQARLDFSKLSSMLSTHAQHEELWVHPLLSACAPDLESELEREHSEHDVRFDAVVDAFDRLNGGGSDAPWALQQTLYRKFAEFCGHYLVHLGREEDEAMPALQERHSDDELLGVSAEIRDSTPPKEMAGFLAVMIPAMNVEERVSMLGGMKANAPKEAFDGVCALASNVLNSDEWTVVRRRVGIQNPIAESAMIR